MTREEFEQLVDDEFGRAIPPKFRPHIKNVAFLVEDNSPQGDLLGLYHGIPTPERGDFYGMGATMPDTITLFQIPIENEAAHIYTTLRDERRSYTDSVRQVVRETIWHEVAHHFGMDEHEVRGREGERDTI